MILHEDHRLPVATINLWCYVGSKDEVARRSGFAHLFEHRMFMGTERVPGGQFDQIMEAGGLQQLGRAMNQEKLDKQREVVRNERRQSYENRPYGRAELRIPGLMSPPGHPYPIPVIGPHEDLAAATLAEGISSRLYQKLVYEQPLAGRPPDPACSSGTPGGHSRSARPAAGGRFARPVRAAAAGSIQAQQRHPSVSVPAQRIAADRIARGRRQRLGGRRRGCCGLGVADGGDAGRKGRDAGRGGLCQRRRSTWLPPLVRRHARIHRWQSIRAAEEL